MKPANDAGAMRLMETVSSADSTAMISQSSPWLMGHCLLICSRQVSSSAVSPSWAKPSMGTDTSTSRKMIVNNLFIAGGVLGIELVNDAGDHAVNDRAAVAQCHSI